MYSNNQNANNQGTANGYSVDIVMCIDGTGSMVPFIDKVKNQAKNFYHMFAEKMNDSNRPVGAMRTKVIVFRDYAVDGAESMQESRFFEMNNADEVEKFSQFVDAIQAKNGGDVPENSLQAISLALKSSWVDNGRYTRQAILLFTDAPALDLGDPDRTSNENYPKDIPQTLEQLYQLFVLGGGQNPRLFKMARESHYKPAYGRLIIFAPQKCDWDRLTSWNHVWFVSTDQGFGCKAVDLQDALAVLVNTI